MTASAASEHDGIGVVEEDVAAEASSPETEVELEHEPPGVQLPAPRPHPPSSGPIALAVRAPVTDEPVTGGHDDDVSQPSLVKRVSRRMAEAPEASARLALVVAGGLAAAVIVLLGVVVALAVPVRDSVEPPAVAATGTLRVGLVHHTGDAGLSRRVLPSVAGDSLPGVPNGGLVEVRCAQSGQLVTDEYSGVRRSSAVWLRTAEGRFASSLYVDLGDPPSIANCVPGQPDLSLVP